MVRGRRKRYIVFRCQDETQARNSVGSLGAKLIYYKRGYGIVRAKHWRKDEVIDRINSGVGETIKTTGSVKKAREILSTYQQPR